MSDVSVSIDVPDLAHAVSFYTQALNFSPVQGRHPNIEIVERDGLKLYLLLQAEGSIPTLDTATKRSYQRHWTPVHLDFSSKNVAQTLEGIEATGGSIESRSDAFAHCVDPFGHGFCVIGE